MNRSLALAAIVGVSGIGTLYAQQPNVAKPDIDQVVPKGAILFFAAERCPGQLQEFQAARGRYIVALPKGGTPGRGRGDPLTNLEVRTKVPKHRHHVLKGGAHKHVVPEGGDHRHDHSIPQFEQTFIDYDDGGNNVEILQYKTTVTGPTESAKIPERPTREDFVPAHDTDDFGSEGEAAINAPYIQLIACQRRV